MYQRAAVSSVQSPHAVGASIHSDKWQVLREIATDLTDQLALARGEARRTLAKCAVRDSRAVLETMNGPEAETVRILLSAVEASGRDLGP
jgi:hypothetical protein